MTLWSKFGDDFLADTTRPPRSDEVDGVVYHFTDRKGFSQLMQANEFFEHGTHNNNEYGTTMSAVRDVVESGHTCVITIHPDVSAKVITFPQ